MGRRGRPAILKDRKTTSVSLESRHTEFILKRGMDLSKFVRDSLDVVIQNEATQLEQLKIQKEELEKERQEKDIQILQIDALIKEAEEEQEKEAEEGKILNELEERRQTYIDERVGTDIETGRIEMYTKEGQKDLYGGQ